MADSSINFQYIQNYSKQFARIVCDNYFREKNCITGKEILEITEVRQVNLLIIKDLYDSWQKEVDSIKSPYFDYSSEPVQEAMKNLRNVLSNNIKMVRPVFELLLARAVEKTMTLLYSPYEFFISLFSSDKAGSFTLVGLKGNRKYIKINTHLYDSFLKHLEEKKILSADSDLLVSSFNEVLSHYNETPDDPDRFLDAFSKTLAVDTQTIYLERENQPAEKPVSSPATVTAENGGKKTLLDEFQENKSDTIADYLKRKTVESIRKSITINQKFMFVRELFKEDEELFTLSINELDNLENLQAAEQYIEVNFFSKNLWQHDSEAVIEFMEVLQKKFS